jgi:hypothetical protein
MSNSQRSFDQVKNILGKLDRNIDAARARRLQGPVPAPAAATIPAPVQTVPARPAFVAPAAPLTPMPTFGVPAPNRSPYGRATPMRSDARTQTGT